MFKFFIYFHIHKIIDKFKYVFSKIYFSDKIRIFNQIMAFLAIFFIDRLQTQRRLFYNPDNDGQCLRLENLSFWPTKMSN